MNSSPQIYSSATHPVRNSLAPSSGVVIPFPGASSQPVVNIKRRGRLPRGVASIGRHRKLRADLLAGLGRRQEMLVMRNKYLAGTAIPSEVSALLKKLDASTEEILFVLGR